MPEEYEVYAAVLSHYYIDEPKSLFSLSGVELKTAPRYKFDQIVVNSRTSNFFSYDLASDQKPNGLPKGTLIDYLQKNSKIYELENGFKISKKLMLVDEDTLDKNLKKYRSQGAANPLVGEYPGALGWFYFSRVGFSEIHNSAIVSYLLKYPLFSQSGPEVPIIKTIFLVNEDGNWIVKKSFPRNEETIINVGSYECEQDSMGYTWSQGSGSVGIGGHHLDKCQLTEFHEVEGGYKKTVCWIPKDFGFFQIFQTANSYTYSKDLSQFCDAPSQGNLFGRTSRKTQKKPTENSKMILFARS